ncbi:MAG: hypothetical protein K8W52_42860 [Deltaproteobacteria bacterium]|nr:hypothetical protein [Deltaproteobacteria bacterium]
MNRWLLTLPMSAALAGCVADDASVAIGGWLDGAIIGGPQHTPIHVDAAQPVVRVELYRDGERIGEAPFAPFVIDWSTTVFPEGPTTLQALGYLPDGTNVGGRISVVFDNTPPSIAYFSGVETGSQVTITVSDNYGVAAVEVDASGKVLRGLPVEGGFAVTWPFCEAVEADIVATDQAGWTTTWHTTMDPQDPTCPKPSAASGQ